MLSRRDKGTQARTLWQQCHVALLEWSYVWEKAEAWGQGSWRLGRPREETIGIVVGGAQLSHAIHGCPHGQEEVQRVCYAPRGCSGSHVAVFRDWGVDLEQCWVGRVGT